MAEILPEKWMKGVAITTTILAVLTAIASSRASYCVAQAQLLTALEGSKWAYYQAKSIKQGLAESQLKAFEADILGPTSPEQRALLQNNIDDYQKNITRYNDEKESIKKEAEKTGKDNLINGRKGSQFSLAVVFFQIGIMLSSVSALLKRREMWIIGLIFGGIACILLANAVFLFF